MNCLNLSYVSTIFTLYDFSQFKTILDIGGGEGVFLSTILKKNPNQLGILFDMPKVIRRAKKKYWTSAAKPLYDHANILISQELRLGKQRRNNVHIGRIGIAFEFLLTR